MRAFKIGNKDMSMDLLINAEMACAHNGDLDIAKKIIDVASDSGADSINFQMVCMEKYMVRNFGEGKSGKGIISQGKDDSDIYKYIDALMFKEAGWAVLFDYARQKNILICAQPNDEESLMWAKNLNPDFYSISSATLSEIELVGAIAAEKKPLLLRISGALQGEIEKALAMIRLMGNEDIVLLYGYQNYPTDIEKINLNFIKKLKSLYGLPVGFADHTDGGNDLALVVPLLAIPFGVAVLEKHITHDRELKCEDFESALGPIEFKKFVEHVDISRTAMGHSYFMGMSESEIEYRNVSKKKIVATRKVLAGHIAQKEDFAFKRADYGMTPDELKYLLGREFKAEILPDQVIELDMFK